MKLTSYLTKIIIKTNCINPRISLLSAYNTLSMKTLWTVSLLRLINRSMITKKTYVDHYSCVEWLAVPV